MNTDPTDELTRLRAEVKCYRQGYDIACDYRTALRAQLATITAERDEARKEVAQRIEQNVAQTRMDFAAIAEWKAEVSKLTVAVVVKDEALRDELYQIHRSGRQNVEEVRVAMINRALSPTSSPLLADLQAAAVALELSVTVFDELDTVHWQSSGCPVQYQKAQTDGTEAIARLARWITPAIEQKPA